MSWGKVHYSSSTGRDLEFYPDDIGYTSIPEPTIDIDYDTWHDCINNQGLRKVDLTALKIVECEAETVTLTTDEKIAALDAEYQPQFTSLAQALGLATLDGNQTNIDSIKSDYAALKVEYNTKRGAVVNA